VKLDNYIHHSDLHNLESAEQILPLLYEIVNFQSVLDVGCGTGSWLKIVEKLGINDLLGIDGNISDNSQLHVDVSLIKAQNLNVEFNLFRKFDLVICLEVAEHLAPKSVEQFVANLVRHSDLILFSAAIPHQGGQNHLNEQWTNCYWINLFEQFNYYPTDLIRPQIWENKKIHWWYKQNVVVFFNRESKYFNLPEYKFHNYVHPDLYTHKVNYFNDEIEIIKQKYESGEWLSTKSLIRFLFSRFLKKVKKLFSGK
jgi:2-polyprenyl-3-methyl-5-hydroxy-6-metoxy-1,4-benzoquinol methylase